MGMKNGLRSLLALLSVALLAAPIALLTTILLRPVWSWLEATYQVESIGHSGPAGWCYGVVYLLLVMLCGVIWAKRRLKGD